jgi:hypothetical protein
MADYVKGEEKVTRIRYRLKTPSNGVELDKMMNAAVRERAGLLSPDALADDALKVSVEDDEIVVWWEVESTP